MNEVVGDHVALVLNWRDLGETARLRRNTAGFGDVKSLAADATREKPLTINAFLYAFLCPAKNFDLFLKENVDAISSDVDEIEQRMKQLEDFEREAKSLPSTDLREIYLATRNWAARAGTRDERRALATLVFCGPSTAEQIAQDLGIGENLASRILRVLGPVIEEQEPDVFALRDDIDTLAVVLQMLQSTLGLDPVRVLRRRIDARKLEGLL